MNYPNSLNARTFRITNGRPRVVDSQRGPFSLCLTKTAIGAYNLPIVHDTPGRNYHLIPLKAHTGTSCKNAIAILDASAATPASTFAESVGYLVALEEAERVAIANDQTRETHAATQRFYGSEEMSELRRRERVLEAIRSKKRQEAIANEQRSRDQLLSEELEIRRELRSQEQEEDRDLAERAAAWAAVASRIPSWWCLSRRMVEQAIHSVVEIHMEEDVCRGSEECASASSAVCLAVAPIIETTPSDVDGADAVLSGTSGGIQCRCDFATIFTDDLLAEIAEGQDGSPPPRNSAHHCIRRVVASVFVDDTLCAETSFPATTRRRPHVPGTRNTRLTTAEALVDSVLVA